MSLSARFPADLMMNPVLKWVGYDGPRVLNIGSGINPVSGAINVDHVEKPGATKVDILEPWPFEPQSFDKVLAFHVLEHVPVEKAPFLFQQAARVLPAGGLFIVEVPDIVGLCREIVNGNMGMIRILYSGDRAPGDSHRWGYDASALATLAVTNGFFQFYTGKGTDYHSGQMATVRLEAVRGSDA